jgi:predicted DNA-binding ribbon-helix-helix protein
VKFKHRKHRRGAPKRSRVDKRSLSINGSNATVSLEDAFWNAIKEIAAVRNIRVSELISTIKIERQPGSTFRPRFACSFSITTSGQSHDAQPQAPARPIDDARQHTKRPPFTFAAGSAHGLQQYPSLSRPRRSQRVRSLLRVECQPS